MRQTITFIFLMLGITAFAQPCNGGRYASNIFTNVDVTSDIQYGQNLDLAGSNVDLLLDFYEPNGDTETARPLIIWVHGGSFIGGSKTDGDMVALATDFAEKGFACASINYRLGLNFPPDSSSAIRALTRAVQDLKATVRFFYKDRATTNNYRIDTTKIFLGGTSAGALTALHYAYLDKPCEIEHYMDAGTLTSLGGIEGDSGNAGYSTDVIGILNGAGALASYAFLEAGDIPVCSVHGDADDVVPYIRDYASVGPLNIIYMDGSRMIDEQASAVGVASNLYTFYGGGHVPYAGNAANMNITINFYRDFVIDLMGCTDTPLQPENTPSGTANLYLPPFCDLNTQEFVFEDAFMIYPNPSDGVFTIETDEAGIIDIIDLTGKKIFSRNIDEKIKVDLGDQTRGLYILRHTNSQNNISIHKLIIE